MALQESGEMYLETILILSRKSDRVRSLDVAEYMNFSKPSVSRAMNILKKDGFIVIDEKGYITLNESGRHLAENIYEKHLFLTRFLERLGIDHDTAEKDACKMEHDISDKTFTALKRHAEEHGNM